jgi:hypothetical protein
VAAPGVLGNDTDVDTPLARVRLVITSPPHHGSLVPNADGSFVYVPIPGYAGQDSFTYISNDGVWSRDPTILMSGKSHPATVTIDIQKYPHKPW